jgi:hypothetical protein
LSCFQTLCAVDAEVLVEDAPNLRLQHLVAYRAGRPPIRVVLARLLLVIGAIGSTVQIGSIPNRPL